MSEVERRQYKLEMTEDMLEALNSSAQMIHSNPLEELAEEDPEKAWVVVESFTEFMTTGNTLRVGGEDQTWATPGDDGAAATEGLAHYKRQEVSPYATLEPLDVVISVFKNQEIRQLIAGENDESNEALRFTVKL